MKLSTAAILAIVLTSATAFAAPPGTDRTPYRAVAPTPLAARAMRKSAPPAVTPPPAPASFNVQEAQAMMQLGALQVRANEANQALAEFARSPAAASAIAKLQADQKK